MARRILMVLWDGGGLVPPVMQVAARLVAAGHAVRVLGDPTIGPEALAVGAEFSALSRAPHRTSRDREADILKDYAAKSPMDHLKVLLGYFVGAGADWTADIGAAIDDHRADLVLTDVLISWGVVAAEQRGIASAAFHTLPYFLPTPGMTPSGAAAAPVPGWLTPLRDGFFRWMMEWVFDRHLAVANRVRAELGLAAVRHVLDQARGADGQIVLTSRLFDFDGKGAPPSVHWVGPQLGDPAWCEPWCSPWADDDVRPLVLVGLSSTYQAQIPLTQRLVDALATLPVRAVVTTGPTIRAGEIVARGDVCVVASAPHSELLPRVALVVTHAGHGTALKTLAAGVPAVCLPMGRDQGGNAGRMKALGVAVVLKPTASVEALRAAVERVLGDAAMRARARELATRLAMREGDEDVVAVVEALLPRKVAAAVPSPVATPV